MKIIILNLPRNFAEDELTALFAKHGSVSACNLVIDAANGISKGFGFVEMDLEAEATAAITALNGSIVGNNKIRVKIAS